MTPEENREVAKAILKAVDKADLSPNGDPVGAIAQALAAREAETVERCAKVCQKQIEYNQGAASRSYERSDPQTAFLWETRVAEAVACRDALRATLKPETKGEGR